MHRFETRVRQLGLVGGIREPTSDLITVAEPGSPFAPEAGKGTLYILVEADTLTPRSRQVCQLALRSIERAFYEDTTFSITAALRRAVAAANKALYQDNLGQSAGRRTTVGVSVAVLKDRDLFVAQVQPAQTYVLDEGVLRALPAHPSWDPAHVSAAHFSRSGALGASLFIDPEMYRCALRPGDSVILCASSFSQLLDRSETNRILRLHDPDAAVEQLTQIAAHHELGDAHALVVELRTAINAPAQRDLHDPDGTAEPEPSPTPVLRAWFATISDRIARSVRKHQPAPAKARLRPDPLKTMPEQPQFSLNPPSLPAPIDMGEDLGARYARSVQEREQHQREHPAFNGDLPPSAYLGEQDFPTSSRRIDLGDGPMLAATARPYRSRYEMRPFVDLTWKERMALPFQRIWLAVDEAIRNRRVRPSTLPPAGMRGQGLSYRRNQINFPWLMFFGLALLIAFLIIYGMTLTRQSNQQLALEYLSAAETRLATVRESTSEATALDSLDLARQAIDAVRSSPDVTDTNPPLWLRYQEIQREYERAQAAIQHLTYFDNLTVLATHPLPDGTFTGMVVPPAATTAITNPAQIEAMHYIYALDGEKANTRLYRIPRDGGDAQSYLAPNTQIGATIIGPLRSAIWRIDQVVAVDQAPEGFGYYFRNGNEWNYSKLGGSEIWKVRDQLRIREYDGNLYVWGAVPNEVLKFRSGNYGDTPEYWLDPASLADIDLSGVTDMTIDGAIYLLKANGSMLIFSQGRFVSAIKPESITPPISAAANFFITNDGFGGGSIFIVETANERIIQVDKLTGEVIQQMKVRADNNIHLNQLGSIAVDTSGPRTMLYFVNGAQIIRTELPAPPRPFRDVSTTPTPATTVTP
jgi:serine/threonine protein phosphatase PrpC